MAANFEISEIGSDHGDRAIEIAAGLYNMITVISFIFKSVIPLMLIVNFTSTTLSAAETGSFAVDLRTQAEAAQILATANQYDKPGDRISAISSHFLGAPYAAHTLIGGPQEAEQLVLDLTAFDCFTFLDVVEALRRSSGTDDFPEQLRKVRYHDGKVAYTARRHFFSDWITDDDGPIIDVTADVGQGGIHTVVKQLNLKEDGAHWLPGVDEASRPIRYIPTGMIDVDLLAGLQAGDYVGFYTDAAGLDVSHTGLIVKVAGKVMLRHASSRAGLGRVVDEELQMYLQGRPGLVVYRVRP